MILETLLQTKLNKLIIKTDLFIIKILNKIFYSGQYNGFSLLLHPRNIGFYYPIGNYIHFVYTSL